MPLKIEKFTGPGSTPARRRFWDNVADAVASCRKLEGNNVSVTEYDSGSLIDVNPQRANTPTGVTGACCYDDGTCDDLTEADCTEAGGVFQGAGTDCDPNPCEAGTCPEGCGGASSFSGTITGSISLTNTCCTTSASFSDPFSGSILPPCVFDFVFNTGSASMTCIDPLCDCTSPETAQYFWDIFDVVIECSETGIGGDDPGWYVTAISVQMEIDPFTSNCATCMDFSLSAPVRYASIGAGPAGTASLSLTGSSVSCGGTGTVASCSISLTIAV